MKWKRNHETVNHAMNFERNGDDTSEKLTNGCVHCAKGKGYWDTKKSRDCHK